MTKNPEYRDLFPGALEMMILQSLRLRPMHGYGLVKHIKQVSNDLLQIEEGSLYPALHRLEDRGWIASFWGTSENNRKARYYRLTGAGRKQLAAQTTRWEQVVRAMARILNPGTGTIG